MKKNKIVEVFRYTVRNHLPMLTDRQLEELSKLKKNDTVVFGNLRIQMTQAMATGLKRELENYKKSKCSK